MTQRVVLLSGGLDSATALAIARARRRRVPQAVVRLRAAARAELDAAARVAALGASAHRVMRVAAGIRRLGAHRRGIAVPVEAQQRGYRSPTFPARNTVFLSLALALAEGRDAGEIVIGVNAVDCSGYPDCRPEYMPRSRRSRASRPTRQSRAARLMLDAPLVTLTKAGIIRLGSELGVDYR